jgi:hypothetical protein
MNRLMLIVLLTLAGLIACTPGKSSEKYKTFTQGSFQAYRSIDTINTIEVERHIEDLNSDSKADTLLLENLRDLAGDPQLYSLIRVLLSTGEEYLMKHVA